MVATFGLNNLTGVGVLVELHLALAAIFGRLLFDSIDRLGIKQIDDTAQAHAIFRLQCSQFAFELNLSLKPFIIFQCIQLLQLLCQLGFKRLKFCEF
ncbi:hypothetical protein D9M70_641280 [compost metagenome]